MFSVPINLDKQRNIRFRQRAMEALETIYPDKGFVEICINMQEKPRMTDIKNILWAGLQWEDKELTPEKMTDILDGDDCDLQDVISKLMKAVETSLNPKNSQAGAVKTKKVKVTPA